MKTPQSEDCGYSRGADATFAKEICGARAEARAYTAERVGSSGFTPLLRTEKGKAAE